VRGLAVLIMIQAHLFDSWTRADARGSWQFAWAMIVAGFGAPMFLFLAGTSVALSAGSKYRRSGDATAAARAVMKRGAWIFFLAFIFRVQAWILGWGPPRTLLKVDILNIMGPSIVVAAALWGAFRTTRARCVAAGGVALAIALVTPIVRTTAFLDPLPNPVEAYLRPIPGLSNFFLFSWSGFVFAGAIAGILLDDARSPHTEARINRWLFGAGAALAAGAYAASFLPTPYAQSEFWGSSPSYFLLRTGILLALIPIAYTWQRMAPGAWSPLQQLGRTSLFIYWIHVEMVYGLISLPIHKTLTHSQAWVAFGLFTMFMLACSVGKDWFIARGGGATAASNRGGPAGPASAHLPVPAARVSTSSTARE
jgi:uncharacterized membrane protein